MYANTSTQAYKHTSTQAHVCACLRTARAGAAGCSRPSRERHHIAARDREPPIAAGAQSRVQSHQGRAWKGDPTCSVAQSLLFLFFLFLFLFFLLLSSSFSSSPSSSPALCACIVFRIAVSDDASANTRILGGTEPQPQSGHTHSPAHTHTHTSTHSLLHSLTHSLLHSLLHSLTHSLLHSLTHSLTHAYHTYPQIPGTKEAGAPAAVGRC